MAQQGQIMVRHTIQMGHRLWSIPGQCQNLHGHTWRVELGIRGPLDANGMLMDYHEVKHAWRGYLDDTFDHAFAFAFDDPLLKAIKDRDGKEDSQIDHIREVYPGAILLPFLPTVENLCSWLTGSALAIFGDKWMYQVELWEGDVNGARA